MRTRPYSLIHSLTWVQIKNMGFHAVKHLKTFISEEHSQQHSSFGDSVEPRAEEPIPHFDSNLCCN